MNKTESEKTFSEKQYYWNKLYATIYEHIQYQKMNFTNEEIASVLYEMAQDIELDDKKNEKNDRG